MAQPKAGVAEKPNVTGEQLATREQLIEVAPGRPPYPTSAMKNYGVDAKTWKVMVEAIWPTATTVDGVKLAIAYCQARNLDPLKRPVHIVPMWNKALGRSVETVWPGINEIVTTASRTGQFAGVRETEAGPTLEATKVLPKRPEWMRSTVLRMVEGVPCPFVGPRVYWEESYAHAGKDSEAPNAMWGKRPFGQLEKCALAAALRIAFPEELGSVYAADEMEGKVIEGDFTEVTKSPAPIPQKVGDVLDELAKKGAAEGAVVVEQQVSQMAQEEGVQRAAMIREINEQVSHNKQAGRKALDDHLAKQYGGRMISSLPLADLSHVLAWAAKPETTEREPGEEG